MNGKDIKIIEEKIEFWEKDPRIMVQEENFKVLQAIKNLINRDKELEEDYTSVYLKGIYDERDKWKSKIKEKIEEVNKSNGYSPVNKILIEQVLNSILKIGG